MVKVASISPSIAALIPVVPIAAERFRKHQNSCKVLYEITDVKLGGVTIASRVTIITG